jgi:hypothetical protein
MGTDKLYQWEIYVLRHEAQLLGIVDATDSNAAIEAAIEEFEIGDQHRHRLFARRVD